MRELIEKLYAKYNIGRGASAEEMLTLKRILAEWLWVRTTDSVIQWRFGIDNPLRAFTAFAEKEK